MRAPQHRGRFWVGSVAALLGAPSLACTPEASAPSRAGSAPPAAAGDSSGSTAGGDVVSVESAPVAPATTSAPMTLAAFLQSESANKLNAPMKAELADLDRRHAGSQQVTVMGKFSAPPTDADKEQISAIGVRLDSVMGTIFSATGPASSIIELAALPNVVQLEKPPGMRVRPPKIAP